MKKKVMTAVLVSIMVLSSSLCAYARPFDEIGDPPHRGPEKMEKMMDEILDEVGVSSEQRDALDALKEKEKAFHKKMREEKKSVILKMKDALDEYDTDMAAIETIKSEALQIETDMIDNRIKHVLAMKKILSEEQFTKLKQKLEIKREVMKEIRKMRREKKGDNGSFRKRKHEESVQ